MPLFSLNSNFKLNEKKLKKLLPKNYPLLQESLYDTIASKSPINDLLFLMNYSNSIYSKLFASLEDLGYFTNRSKVQQFIDSMSAATLIYLNVYVETGYNIENALKCLIDQTLKIIYDNTNFLSYILTLEKDVTLMKYKIVIEPVIINESDFLNENDIEILCNNLIYLLNYASKESYISISILISQYNKKDFDVKNIPELFDDNIIPGFYEKYPELYISIFHTRQQAFKVNFNADIDNYFNIELLNKNHDMEYSIIDENLTEDEHIIQEYQLPNYATIIDKIFYVLNSNNNLIALNHKDINFKKDSDIPVTLKIHQLLNKDNENPMSLSTFGMQDLIKEIYENDNNNEQNDIDNEELFNKTVKTISEEEFLNMFGATNGNNNLDDNEIDDICSFEIKKDNDGFYLYITDENSEEDNNIIYDYKAYIEEFLNISSKVMDDNKSIKKLFESYNKANVKVEKIKKEKDLKKVIFTIKNKNYAFTFDPMCAIIDSVKTKDLG